jgi:hypothetical protein
MLELPNASAAAARCTRSTCCYSRSSSSARISSAASRNGTGLGGAAKLEQCDAHPVQPVAGQIDDQDAWGEAEHGMELAQGQLQISRVEQEKAELLVTVRLVGAVAGV